MTRIKLVASIFGLLVITGAAHGWAQSLGEVAKREEEKKKKSGKPPATAKVYTDEDLKKARKSGTSAVNFLPENENTSSSSSSSSSGADQERSGGDEGGGGGEKYWRNIAKQRREAVQEAEQEVKTLESRIAALRNDMSPTNVQDPTRLQTQGRDLQKAQEDLEAARHELEQARQSLANLEDEARRAGAMPGWVR
jgi:chromosome segregation ATPase